MHGQQRLIGRHHVLARGNRFQHQGLGDAVATDQLDHHVDVGVGDDGAGIAHHLDGITDDLLGARGIQVGHHGNLNATTRAAADLFLVALQHVESAAAHGANAQQAYLDRFHSLITLSRQKGL